MTETEWLTCTEPEKMLAFLSGKASERKLRLFAVACCRRIWRLLSEQPSKQAVLLAEQYADGHSPETALHAAEQAAWNSCEELNSTSCSHQAVVDSVFNPRRDYASEAAAWAACRHYDWLNAKDGNADYVAQTAWAVMEAIAAQKLGTAPDLPWQELQTLEATIRQEERRIQSNLLRDLFGNLFRPVALDPAWLAWKDGIVVKLAQNIYNERAFDRLPVLADALEEAGGTNQAILDHCRQPGEHVRGCWVVDCCLGKS